MVSAFLTSTSLILTSGASPGGTWPGSTVQVNVHPGGRAEGGIVLPETGVVPARDLDGVGARGHVC